MFFGWKFIKDFPRSHIHKWKRLVQDYFGAEHFFFKLFDVCLYNVLVLCYYFFSTSVSWIILVDRKCWLSGHNHLYITQGHIIIYFFIGTNSMFACFQMYVKSTFFLLFFFSTFMWFFFSSPQTCVDSVGATIFTFPVVIQLHVYCSAQSFCFLEKQNFLFTSFNLKEAMRLSSTHVMKMTWKQNKQSQKAFRRQNVQYSRKICLRLTVFVLNQVRVFVSGAYRHTQHTQTWLFTQKNN